VLSDNAIDAAVRGLEIRNSAATFGVSGTTITDSTSDGILLADNTGTIQLTGTNTVDNAAGVGVNIQGGTATVSFDDIQVTNYRSSAIALTGSGGQVTFNQALSLDNANGTTNASIAIANTTGNVTFNGVTITDTSRAAVGLPSINLSNNGNTTTFGDLNITTNMGGGFRALNVGTLNVSGGTLNSVGGTALDVNGVTSADMTFTSISASGTPNGVLFQTTNSAYTGNLRILGDGQTAGSGGTIDVTGTGVFVSNVENLSLNFLDITSGVAGVLATNTDNLVVNRSLLSSLTDDWTGVRVLNDTNGKTGAPIIITQNTINGTGANQTGIFIRNDESPFGAANISGNAITLSSATSTGIALEANDTGTSAGPGDITIFSNSDNIVNGLATPFAPPVQTGATIFGQILVNGILSP